MFHPAEVENALLELDNVVDAVVSGERNRSMGHVPVARLVLARDESRAELTKQVRRHLRDRPKRFKVHARVEVVSKADVNAPFKKVRPGATQPDHVEWPSRSARPAARAIGPIRSV